MTFLKTSINLRYIYLTLKPAKKHVSMSTTFCCSYWYISIYSEKGFWPQYMYRKLSPFNGWIWLTLGKLSHIGLERLTSNPKGLNISDINEYKNNMDSLKNKQIILHISKIIVSKKWSGFILTIWFLSMQGNQVLRINYQL